MASRDAIMSGDTKSEPVGDRSQPDGGFQMMYRSKKAWWSVLLFVGLSLTGVTVGVVLLYAGIVNP